MRVTGEVHPVWDEGEMQSLRRVARRALGVSRALVSARFVDRPLGIDTSGVISSAELGAGGDEVLGYEPSSWLALPRILKAEEVDPDDVFIDIGSGKGRVVYQAAKYPFKRVIGVEISDELNEIARRNVDRSRDRLAAPVEFVTADATTYEIPADVTVVYLYNPFMGSLFEQAVRNVVASYDAHPRLVRLISRSLGPEESALLEKQGRFQLVKSVKAPRPTRKWAESGSAVRMYVVTPQRRAE